MRCAFLEVVEGPYAAHSEIIQPGDIVRIGRCPKAEIHLHDDAALADLHCAATFDGSSVRVYSLGNSILKLGAKRALNLSLRSGDQFVAGSTRLECQIPADRDFPFASQVDDSPISQVANYFRQVDRELFVIVDSAKRPAPEFLRSLSLEHESLYQGKTQKELADVAPYLVHLPRNSPQLEILLRWGWGRSCLTFAFADGSLADLRRHFRKFLLVWSGDKTSFFRFFDPRVLAAFLKSASHDELAKFFGPVVRFAVEGDRPTMMNAFQFVRRGSGETQGWATQTHTTKSISVAENVMRSETFGLSVPPGLLTLGNGAAALHQVAKRNFLLRLVSYCRGQMPAICGPLSDAQLFSSVSAFVVEAEHCGAKTEQGIAMFVCLRFLPCDPFHRIPQVSDYLSNNPEISIDRKLKVLVQQVKSTLAIGDYPMLAPTSRA